MKACLLVSLLLALSMPALGNFNLNQDFISGFESGIFLRGNPQAIEEQYGCPKPVPRNEGVNKLTSMIAPMKMMAAMVPD